METKVCPTAFHPVPMKPVGSKCLCKEMAHVRMMFSFKNRLKRKGREHHIVFLAAQSHVPDTTAFSLLCLCVLPRLYGARKHVKTEAVLCCILSTQQKKTPNSEKKLYGIFMRTNCRNTQWVLSHHGYKQANCLAIPCKPPQDKDFSTNAVVFSMRFLLLLHGALATWCSPPSKYAADIICYIGNSSVRNNQNFNLK